MLNGKQSRGSKQALPMNIMNTISSAFVNVVILAFSITLLANEFKFVLHLTLIKSLMSYMFVII